MRTIAGKMSGWRCCYCHVPTAATIEHIQARSKGGKHEIENLRVCCPYCNTRKGTKSLESFLAERGWELEYPDDLPSVTREMLRREFGWDQASGLVATNSVHAKLELRARQVSMLVRPHAEHEWLRFHLGPADDPVVTQAAWGFLKRHHTPTERKRRPPKHVFGK
jgi:hypothetical protein